MNEWKDEGMQAPRDEGMATLEYDSMRELRLKE